MAPPDVNIDWVGETNDTKFLKSYTVAPPLESAELLIICQIKQCWAIWNSNLGEENGKNIWINNINIRAIDVYFRSSRSMLCRRLFHYPTYTRCRRSRLSSACKLWRPPRTEETVSFPMSSRKNTMLCRRGRFISWRVHVAGKAGSRQWVSVPEPNEPAKPAFCRAPRRDRWIGVTCYTPTQRQWYWTYWCMCKYCVSYLLTTTWISLASSGIAPQK